MDLIFLLTTIIIFCVNLQKQPVVAMAHALSMFVLTVFIYASMNRIFIAISLCIIYLGAIMVLVLFVIMLTQTITYARTVFLGTQHVFLTLLACFFYKNIIFKINETKFNLKETFFNNTKILFFQDSTKGSLGELNSISFNIYVNEFHFLKLCAVLLLISLIVSITIVKIGHKTKTIF